jgi:hypothetical protein
VRRCIVLHGGQINSPATLFNDTWEWDGTAWTQLFPANSPARRQFPRAAFDVGRGRMVLFGGYVVDFPALGYFTDTWDWDGTNWTLRTFVLPPFGPAGRQTHMMAFDPVRGRTVLFGGANTTGDLNDTWEYGPTHPAEVAPYGQGCTGSAGVPAHSASNLPWLGDTYILSTSPLPTPALGFLFLGFDRTQWNGVPLPLDLTPLGLLGCSLAVEIPLLFAANSPGAALSWSLPVGNTPDLLGFSFFTQSLHLDPPANPFGATTSNGLRHRIGGR